MNQAVLHLTPEQAHSVHEVSKKCTPYSKYLILCGLLSIYGFKVPMTMPKILLGHEMLTLNW